MKTHLEDGDRQTSETADSRLRDIVGGDEAARRGWRMRLPSGRSDVGGTEPVASRCHPPLFQLDERRMPFSRGLLDFPKGRLRKNAQTFFNRPSLTCNTLQRTLQTLALAPQGLR
jgi:hypothetical protein